MLSEKKLQVTENAADDDMRFFNRIQNPYIARREEGLARIVKTEYQRLACPEAAILEVGCGEGSNLYWLDRVGVSAPLTGVDFSPKKIEFAQHHVERARFLVADAVNLPFDDNTFSLVVMRDLLHHVNWDRDGVVREACRVLRPGGTIIVFEGNPKDLLVRIAMRLMPFERGMRDSTQDMMCSLFERYGRVEVHEAEKSSILRSVFFVACRLGQRMYRLFVRIGFLFEWLSSIEAVFRTKASAAYFVYRLSPHVDVPDEVHP